ncbi:MAG: Stp1/IreP family PP2C-type Ser/Thr phosphatase [Bdellovibrionaceae bacterium]|nr:Stp1/IreP family PP2C-type Ser/Thr phosphatase [Bdellovibrionales bacterium]MCB9086359.1 Stp1/IreP family PP2C-type Ser/Thr phosphatase [Pseudobdellovibrionaceae bacterium]
MKFDVWAKTDVGLKRDINQDTILVDPELNLFIVADGMGGHKGGEVASALAVETVQEVIRTKLQSKGRLNPKDAILEAYRESSTRIHAKSTLENPELMGMGTTMVLIFGHGNKLYIGNVGDSRAYLYRDPYLWQLTEDHSLINEQVKAGVISEEDAPHVIGRNVITRSVGYERDVIVDVLVRDFQPGEQYLLCSDGLSSLVADQKVAEIFKTSEPQEVVLRCIDKAKAAGGDDNVSVVLVRVRQ